MTATRTASRCVPGRNYLITNTMTQRLVFDKELCLSVRPAMDSATVFFPTIERTVTDTFKVFHHNTACIDRLGESHQLLTGNMEEVLRYGLFPTRQSFEKTFRGRRANTSDFLTGIADTCSAMVEGTTADIQRLTTLGLDSYKQILDAGVYTNDRSGIPGIRDVHLDGKNEEPRPTDKFETRIRPITFRDSSTFVLGLRPPDGQSFGGDVEVTFPANGNDDLFVDGEFPFAVGLHAPVSGDDMAEQGASDLTWELKLLSDGGVELVGEGSGCFHDLSVVDDVGKPICGITISDADLVQLGVAGG